MFDVWSCIWHYICFDIKPFRHYSNILGTEQLSTQTDFSTCSIKYPLIILEFHCMLTVSVVPRRAMTSEIKRELIGSVIMWMKFFNVSLCRLFEFSVFFIIRISYMDNWTEKRSVCLYDARSLDKAQCFANIFFFVLTYAIQSLYRTYTSCLKLLTRTPL